jgi:uncharacterized membrane protein
MTASILYCGDTDLTSAAAYLAGVMTHFGLAYEYVPSHVPLTRDLLGTRALFILSDYPAAMIDAALQSEIVAQVERGAGLLMIGGWESFHGFGGNWDGTPIGDVLPVEIAPRDDRCNFSQSAYLLAQDAGHPILEGLLWEQPPAIGGMNELSPKPQSRVLLAAQPLRIVREADDWRFAVAGSRPLLVTGQHGRGRTAAMMTDVAPHWVGGFVDWGDGRVTAQAAGAGAIEVGHWYAQFWRQLIEWTMTHD